MPRLSPRPARRRAAPRAEALESRALLATFTVNTTADSGAGSLRQAILSADSTPGADVIDFAIGTGPQTIAPLTALPAITDPVTIDGTSQPGYNGTPIIEINGAGAGNFANGLTITTSNTVVRGLVINRFDGNGILLQGNGKDVIQGNYIGTDTSGANPQGNSADGISGPRIPRSRRAASWPSCSTPRTPARRTPTTWS